MQLNGVMHELGRANVFWGVFSGDLNTPRSLDTHHRNLNTSRFSGDLNTPRSLDMMKPKRLKVYARLRLISTKLPIVKDLIEID